MQERVGLAKRVAKSLLQQLERAANAKGYRIGWVPATLIAEPRAELTMRLEYAIAHLLLSQPSIFFLQIGANDGVTTDPIYKFVTRYHWHGILVEPVPEVFERLKKNYGGEPNLQFVNAAVGEADGVRTLYTLKADAETEEADRRHRALPSSYSSFRKDLVLGQTEWVPDAARRIRETEVRCVSLDTLLREAGEPAIDLIVTDTEGYDFAILKMIDFSRLQPPIIFYEHVLMSRSERQQAAELLFTQGYRLASDEIDTIAYRASQTFDWRELDPNRSRRGNA
jgi:FkbM family methyltransferase